jgi:hypothetical protein
MGAFRCGGCEGDDDAMVYNPIDNTAPQRAPTPQVFSAGEGAVDDGKTKKIKIYMSVVKTVVVMRIFSFRVVTLIFVTTKLTHSSHTIILLLL